MIIDRIDEEFLLFALDPDGRFKRPRTGSLEYGLAGAWLAELCIDGYVKVDHGRIVNRNHTQANEKTLDWALYRLRGTKRKRRTRYWVYRLGKRAPRHIHDVMKRLEGRGHITVQKEHGKFRYPVRDPEAKGRLRDRLWGVLHGTYPADESTTALLAILDGAGLLPHVFGHALDAQQRLLFDRLLARDHRFTALHEAVRKTKGWTPAVWLP